MLTARELAETRAEVLLERMRFVISTGEDTPVVFAEVGEGPGLLALHLHLTEEIWSAIGSPDEVTLTIEPGDRLNES